MEKIMKPFSDQPNPGQKVVVFLKSGKETTARCCQVDAPGFSGLQWYDKKTGTAIDVNKINGWWPYN